MAQQFNELATRLGYDDETGASVTWQEDDDSGDDSGEEIITHAMIGSVPIDWPIVDDDSGDMGIGESTVFGSDEDYENIPPDTSIDPSTGNIIPDLGFEYDPETGTSVEIEGPFEFDPFWNIDDRETRLALTGVDEFGSGEDYEPSLYDFLVRLGYDPDDADDVADRYGNDPAMMDWYRSAMIADYMDDQQLNYGIGSLPPETFYELQSIISSDPTAPTEDPDYVDTWMYDQGYIDRIGREIDSLLSTDVWTADLINQLADLRGEFETAQSNIGSMRPDSPYADFDFENLPDVATGADPWIPEGGDYDPFDIAGRGPFAPGYVLGGMFGAEQAADMLNRDPWGLDWNLPAPISVDIPDMTEEEQGAFLASDRFFTSLMGMVEERDLTNPYTGEPDLNVFWQQIEAENPEIYERLRDMYNYHGANWEQYADTYYKSAQKAMMDFYQSPEYGPAAAERIRAIIPLAASIAPALGLPPEVLERQLREAAEAAESGEDYDVSWVFDAARNLDSDLGGPDLGGPGTGGPGTGGPGTGGPGTGGPTGGPGPGSDTLSIGFGASNADVFGGQRPSGFSSDRINAVGDAVFNNSRDRGVTNRSELETISVPKFVLNARQNEGYMHPVNQWLQLDANERDRAIAYAGGQGWDTDEVDMINPNADIYSSSDTGSEFYIPEWLAAMIVDGEKVNGETPSFEWWQEIGAEERSLLQSEHAADGDSTTLMAIHRIIDGVTEEATLTLNASGDIVAEWSDDGPYTSSGVDYGMPMASIDEAMLYLIANNDSELNPMYGTAYENSFGSSSMLRALSENPGLLENGVKLRSVNRYDPDDTRPNSGGTGHGYYELQSVGSADGTPANGSFRINFETNELEEYVSYPTLASNGRTGWIKWEGYQYAGGRSEKPYDKARRLEYNKKMFWWVAKAYRDAGAGIDHSEQLFTDDEFEIFRDNFGDYIKEQGLDFNTLVPPNLTDEALGNIFSGVIGVGPFDYDSMPGYDRTGGFQWETTGQTDQASPYGGALNARGNAVAFNPEHFFEQYMGAGYEMTDASKRGFWAIMDQVNPFYNQYQDWWDGMYTDELAVPSFATFANNPEQTRIYAGPKPVEADFDYPGNYLDAAREWDEKVRDGYAQVLAIASNNFAPDPMLQWLANNPGILESNQSNILLEEEEEEDMATGGLVSLAVGGSVPPQGIGGLGGGPPPEAGMGGGGISEMLPGQMPSLPMENMDLYEIVQNDPVLMGAAMAIIGQHPDPESAIQQAIEMYGEEIIQSLIQAISQQGALQGPGDGLSDSIPATIDGQQPATLSSGEFVVPADVVSHLGNGDNQSGASSLQGMMQRARQQRTGNPQSPPPIDPSMVMPI